MENHVFFNLKMAFYKLFLAMDVSADLRELGRTPVAVVCAGAKSILDIGRTLEFLETEGVAVIGYGTDDFPAFFSPRSGYPVSARLNSSEQVARVIGNNFCYHKLRYHK
jgi:pseudouridine-5'-phosphate glycosidase